MTKDELKRKLKSAWPMQKQLDNDYEELQHYHDMAMRCTTVYSKAPGGASGNGQKIENAVVEISEIEATIQKDIKELESNLHEVDCLIELLSDKRLIAIMRAHYRHREHKSWERIAKEFGYSWRRIMQLHEAALNIILKKIA